MVAWGSTCWIGMEGTSDHVGAHNSRSHAFIERRGSLAAQKCAAIESGCFEFLP